MSPKLHCMKWALAVAAVLTFGGLAAAAFAQQSREASSAGAASEQAAAAAQFARGAKAWADNCNNCHNVRDPQELTDKEWDVAVNHMRIRANLPGDIARDIKAFLKASN